jgi:diguanylate cyclase (GGDEF)-like protein
MSTNVFARPRASVFPLASPDAAARYVRGMERLLIAVQELSLARGIDAVQRVVRTAAREMTGCDGATFVLRDGNQCWYVDEDAIGPLWKGRRFSLDRCVSGWAMLHREPAVIPDIYLDARVPHEAYRPTFVKSLVMVPIRALEPIGAIGNYWAEPHQPRPEEVHLLQALADSTSIAMENIALYTALEQRVLERTAELEQANAEIRHLSVTDELTGLYNRRGFYERAEAALAESVGRSGQCALVFIDVDGLKRTNDERGHDAGDALLVNVARVLSGAFGAGDVIARLGGDEFCVLRPVAADDPAVYRQRLQRELDRINGDLARIDRVSISVGVTLAEPELPLDLDLLIARADTLMYEEKRTRPTTRAA